MGKQMKHIHTKKFEDARRLKELKKKLKPYRNSRTVNLLRVITGSSRVCLDNYWESLESVLTGQYSQEAVTQRIQSVVNQIFKEGEYAKPQAAHSDSKEPNMLRKNFKHLNINSKANMSDNVTHVEIDSKANVFDNFRHGDIDSKANVFGDVRHANINSRASVFDNVAHSDIDSKSNVLGNVTHGNINSNSNVFDNVRHGSDLKGNVINRLNHLHINGCNPECYKRL